MKTLIAAIALALLSAVGASAQEPQVEMDRTDSLATACRVKFPLDFPSSTADVLNGPRCTATIGSFREVIDLLPVLVPDRTKQLHIAQSASNGQLANVFVLYVKPHPAVENKLSF